MTPDQHLAEAERHLVEAERIEKTPRVHLSKNFALLSIAHSLSALAQSAHSGLTPGASGHGQYLRIANSVERLAHAATEQLERDAARPRPDGHPLMTLGDHEDLYRRYPHEGDCAGTKCSACGCCCHCLPLHCEGTRGCVDEGCGCGS